MKLLVFFLLTLGGLLLTGCFALPVEEPVLPPPITTIPEGRTMRTFQVERGDVLRFSNPSAQYLPLRQEAMHFTVAGRRIRGVFVSLGDEVQEGDLLAELENPYIFYTLRDERWNEEWVLLQISQLNERHNFSLNQAGITGNPIDDSHYVEELSRLRGELELVRMRIAHIETEIDEMQIRAPFDGIITWVMDFHGVMWSGVGQPVVTVSDKGQYLFRLAGRDTEFVTIGEYYNLTISGEVFPAIAISPAEMEIVRPTQGNIQDDEVFFQLVGDEMPLIAGTMFAQVFVLHEAAYDVVMLPTMHINTVGERTFVHVLEDDIIVIRDIVTGLVGNNVTEIIYGLEEGDLVVL